MKQGLLTLSICLFLAACGGRTQSESSGTETTTADHTAATDTLSASAQSPTEAPAVAAKGSQLIASSDCMSCHRDNEKLVGPAYADVAKKYENNEANVKLLADKIIKGGSGNWGEVPMTPHPAISEADATEMVKYILSVK